MTREEALKKWIKALRSGEYAQGRLDLKADRNGVVRYCCLGVLCEILKDDLGLKITPQDTTNVSWRYDNCQASLPQKVRNLMKFKDPRGDLPEAFIDGIDTKHNNLANVNDYGYFDNCNRMTFDDIANLIEEQFLSKKSS